MFGGSLGSSHWTFKLLITERILFSLHSLKHRAAYRHVGFAASVHGFSHRVHQVAADAKVAHLHLALSVDQDIGGFHIWKDGQTNRTFSEQSLC